MLAETTLPSSLIAGKYRAVRVLGQGGMGRVLEVVQEGTGKRAALKILHARDDGDHASASKRLLREAQAMARIQHRNVVDVYDVLDDNEDVYLVMALLEGETLAQRVQRGLVSAPQLIAWLCAAMRGVAACHAAGVIHRDIKPENVFLARGDDGGAAVPVVIDFGISKLSGSPDDQATRSGLTMGTPRYVSYEQLRGAKNVDARTDIYAFGVILYEALTGRPPYEAKTFGEQAIAMAVSVPHPVLALRPEVPTPLAQLVEQAITRERERRIASVEAFVERLAPFADEEAYAGKLWAYPPRPEPARDERSTLQSGGDFAYRQPSLDEEMGGSEIPLGSPPSDRPFIEGQSGAGADGESRKSKLPRAAWIAIGLIALANIEANGEPSPSRLVRAVPAPALGGAPVVTSEHGGVLATADAMAAHRGQIEPASREPKLSVESERRTPSLLPHKRSPAMLDRPPKTGGPAPTDGFRDASRQVVPDKAKGAVHRAGALEVGDF